MKKKVLIISGGISKERTVSLETGKQVAKELKKNGYSIRVCEPDQKLTFHTKNFKPQVIFNALHGQFGEDGYIQSILETLKIPYTHSGVISSAKAMDKEISKKIFLKNKILTPKFFSYSFDKHNKKLTNLIEKKLSFPVVIKPINEGSSLNVFICSKANILKKLKLLKNYKRILIEQFIPGREIQAAIIGKRKLGAIELNQSGSFMIIKQNIIQKLKQNTLFQSIYQKKNIKNL